MKKRFAPKDVIPESQREWKQLKRRQWRAVMKAADEFLLGAAFTPADDPTKVRSSFHPTMLDDMKSIKRALSIKEWGR